MGDVCEVFQDQLNCFKNKAQCKGMLPVVKQAAESAAEGKKCSFSCGSPASNDNPPAKLRTADELQTCKSAAQKKATEQIQDATGDAAKSKKLFEEDLCKIWQEQLNCFGEDKDACEAAIPDMKKGLDQVTRAVKSLYDVQECDFKCDGSASSAYVICPLSTFMLLLLSRLL